MWRNVYVTFILFFSSWGMSELVKSHNYSIFSLLARVTQLHIFFFIGTNVLIKINNTLQDDLIQDWKLKDDHLVPATKSIIQFLNYFKNLLEQELFHNQFGLVSLIFFLGQLLAFLGKKYTGITLFRFFSFFIFIIPRLYEWKSQEFNDFFQKIKKDYKEKVPPQYQNISVLFIAGSVSENHSNL